MPYIPNGDRECIKLGFYPMTPGNLNYVITQIIDGYLQRLPKVNYEAINMAIGVLECAKLELYRRIASPYEDQKLHENGDVYSIGVKHE